MKTVRSQPWSAFRQMMRRHPRSAVAAALLLLFVVAAWRLYPQFVAWQHWRTAQAAIDDGDFHTAVEHLHHCCAAWPNSAATWFLLGRTSRRDGDIVAARTSLQRAKRLHHSPDALALEFSLIEGQTGAVKAAERVLLRRLQQGDTDELLIYEALVQGYWRNNFLDEAYALATKWSERAPGAWQPFLMRGVVLQRGRSFALAIADFQHVLELRPDQFAAHAQLADLYLRCANQPDMALAEFAHCARLRPDDVGAKVGMALAHKELHHFDQARALLRDVIDRNTDSGDAYLALGSMEWEQERPEAALPLLRRAVALAPAKLETNDRLATVLRALGKDDEAAVYEKRRHQCDADRFRVDQLNRELRLAAMPQDPAAKAKLVQLRYELGVVLLRLGSDEEGLSWLMNALQEDGSHEPSRRALKEYYERHRRRPAQSPLVP